MLMLSASAGALLSGPRCRLTEVGDRSATLSAHRSHSPQPLPTEWLLWSLSIQFTQQHLRCVGCHGSRAGDLRFMKHKQGPAWVLSLVTFVGQGEKAGHKERAWWFCFPGRSLHLTTPMGMWSNTVITSVGGIVVLHMTLWYFAIQRCGTRVLLCGEP